MKITKIAASIISMGLAGVPVAHATNGMNLEGYGPVAAAMGGASMAYDNGTAAVMNNPATLGLMKDGSSRFDAAIGGLFPDVSSSMTGMPAADSAATAFYMPAIGYVRKSGQLTYGAGVFSQGGMGTEYAANSFMASGGVAAGTGDLVRSEVGVGRAIIPLAFQVDDKITVGGSVDYVWAGMDLKMALTGSQFGDLISTTVPGMSGANIYGKASGNMVDTFAGSFGAGANQLSGLNWARIDFSDNSAFTGEAKGTGFAFKLGGTFKASNQLTLGATYHSKTALGDLKTTGASMSMNVTHNSAGVVTVPVTGSVSVKNFQWPQTMAMGAAYQANDQLLVVADFKRIGWKDVMKDFSMTFTADATQANPMASGFGLGGQVIDMKMYQNWDDQNVFELGAAYKLSSALTVRAGVNMANNPVPDKFMNPLFPAIAKNHITGGVGYVLSSASNIDVSFAYVPKSSATNGGGVTVDFGGFSSQFVYSYQY